ncbi:MULTISPECIES: YggT family protein [Amylolactobacillus]|uniref:YggT family protein n=1 Tax=Amylolactobacillus amylophilus DSM 20533 = JCM 1125 TaxID=1423721 RepID=A0A1L6XDQ5_9LACO|nr:MULTISPECIES: YggT family protein [Amylolactobacillus]APT19106.1 YggT family protein [Amylolactobacillus amylophilus DSM 20533 = JCM 1125]GED79592.1 hypothetical protein LAM01_00650 [Amylolactobacillus amylophilus]
MVSLLQLLYTLLTNLIDLYTMLIVVYTLFTWVPALMNSRAGELLGKVVNPYLDFFDRYIPPIAGISFSPVVAILVLYLVNRYVLYNLFSFIAQLLV